MSVGVVLGISNSFSTVEVDALKLQTMLKGRVKGAECKCDAYYEWLKGLNSSTLMKVAKEMSIDDAKALTEEARQTWLKHISEMETFLVRMTYNTNKCKNVAGYSSVDELTPSMILAGYSSVDDFRSSEKIEKDVVAFYIENLQKLKTSIEQATDSFKKDLELEVIAPPRAGALEPVVAATAPSVEHPSRAAGVAIGTPVVAGVRVSSPARRCSGWSLRSAFPWATSRRSRFSRRS